MTRRTRRFAHALIALTTAACAVVSLAGGQGDPEVQLKAAMRTETVDGNLQAAIAQYEHLAKSTNRAVAAKALARLGQCYEKLGAAQTDRARRAYEEIVARFADQAESVAQARARLAVLGKHTSGSRASERLRFAIEPTIGGIPGTVEAVMSRDGRYFAYTVRNGRALRVRDLVTGNEREIELGDQKLPGQAGFLVFSPDARQVAYPWFTGQPAAAEARVVAASGGTPRVLGKVGGLEGWSPDGKEVYAVTWTDNSAVGTRTAISVSDGTVRPLPNWHFDWSTVVHGGDVSPDGRYVASTRHPNYTKEDRASGRTPPPETYVAMTDVTTGKEVRVTGGDTVDQLPIWSPDGDAILFLRDAGEGSALWAAPVKDGQPAGAPTLVRTFASKIHPVAVTRDGAFHYFQSENVGRRYVVTVGADHKVGTESTPVELPFAGGYAYGWAGDGQRLAILLTSESERAKARGGFANDVLTVRSAGRGGTNRECRPGLQKMSRPRWSPDGRTVMVSALREKTYGFWTIDPSTCAAKLSVRLAEWVDGDANVPAGDWTPDGGGVLIARRTAQSEGHELVLHDFASGRETVRYTLPWSKGMFWPRQTSMGPDGTAYLLANLRNDDKSMSRAVVGVPATGREPRVVFETTDNNAYPPTSSVAADGKGVWVALKKGTRDNPAARELQWVPVKGGEAVSSGLTMAGLDGVVPSPDGSKLLLIQNLAVQQLWSVDHVLPAKKGH